MNNDSPNRVSMETFVAPGTGTAGATTREFACLQPRDGDGENAHLPTSRSMANAQWKIRAASYRANV
jgi:hypothetical protein